MACVMAAGVQAQCLYVTIKLLHDNTAHNASGSLHDAGSIYVVVLTVSKTTEGTDAQILHNKARPAIFAL